MNAISPATDPDAAPYQARRPAATHKGPSPFAAELAQAQPTQPPSTHGPSHHARATPSPVTPPHDSPPSRRTSLTAPAKAPSEHPVEGGPSNTAVAPQPARASSDTETIQAAGTPNATNPPQAPLHPTLPEPALTTAPAALNVLTHGETATERDARADSQATDSVRPPSHHKPSPQPRAATDPEASAANPDPDRLARPPSHTPASVTATTSVTTTTAPLPSALLASATGPGTPVPHEAMGPRYEAPSPTPPYLSSLPIPIDHPRFTPALGEHIAWMLQGTLSRAEIALHPADMGPIRVELALQDGAASLQLMASHTETQHALEAALPHLKSLFETRGLALGAVQVSPDTRQGFESSSQFQQSGQPNSGRNSPEPKHSLLRSADTVDSAPPETRAVTRTGLPRLDLFA